MPGMDWFKRSILELLGGFISITSSVLILSGFFGIVLFSLLGKYLPLVLKCASRGAMRLWHICTDVLYEVLEPLAWRDTFRNIRSAVLSKLNSGRSEPRLVAEKKYLSRKDCCRRRSRTWTSKSFVHRHPSHRKEISKVKSNTALSAEPHNPDAGVIQTGVGKRVLGKSHSYSCSGYRARYSSTESRRCTLASNLRLTQTSGYSGSSFSTTKWFSTQDKQVGASEDPSIDRSDSPEVQNLQPNRIDVASDVGVGNYRSIGSLNQTNISREIVRADLVTGNRVWITELINLSYEYARSLFAVFLVCLVSKSYVAELRSVLHSSMYPTFEEKDGVIVEKVSYHFKNPGVNDIIVFKAPKVAVKVDCEQDIFIKRVVARAGDCVEVHKGVLVVNGVARNEAFVKKGASYDMSASHVPEGCIFVMGDNRINSYDSRQWGPLPLNCVVGRVVFCYRPPHRQGSTFGY